MKVSVHRVKKTARKVEITLRRTRTVRVVSVGGTEPEVSMPELFAQPAEDLREYEAAVEETVPVEPAVIEEEQQEPSEDSADEAEHDETEEMVEDALEEIDEELAELEAFIAAEEAAAESEETVQEPAFVSAEPEGSVSEELVDEEPVEEIFSGEPLFEFTASEEESVDEEPVEEIFSGEPLFEYTVPVSEEPAHFTDGATYDYESVDIDGDGVPEKGVFRRFFDRFRKSSDEDTADGVEYLCVDDDSGRVSRLCGMIKKHEPEDEE